MALAQSILVGLIILLGLGAAQGVVAQPAAGQRSDAPSNPGQSAPVDSSYLVGIGDVVEINLVGRADFGSRARVSTDGTILLPLVGSIKAADRTQLELAEDVRQALIKGGFYSDPVVRVEVVGISSRYATVLGAVGSPGLLPLDRDYRLSEIIARVGGRAGGGVDYVLVTPAAGGTPKKFWLSDLASGGPDDDPVVRSGDKIYIPTAENESFYISGQVNSPGAYPVTQGMTFRKAIAKGGGLTENGSEKKLRVVRNGKPLKGVKLEDTVQVDDVITIGERLF
jgi:polysaccharide biosynthesis/export protein